MTDTGGADHLTPTQQQVLAALRVGTEPVVFPADDVADLRADATRAMEELSVRLGGEPLAVFKHFLARVHGCEVLHLQPDDFRWTPANAAGSVAHKAIELALHWRGTVDPAVVVDEAIARLSDQASSRGDFVAGLTDGEHAELRSRAVDRTTKFLQQFPPIPTSAQPVLESSIRWRAGTIELIGKADLVVGRPLATESRRLIVDFKSGARSPTHIDDLRFYALLETLSQRVPPRKLVTYYLDYADLDVEDVTIDLLYTALRRTTDGVSRHLDLVREQALPVKKEGPPCRWCPVQSDCPEGTAYLRERDLSS